MTEDTQQSHQELSPKISLSNCFTPQVTLFHYKIGFILILIEWDVKTCEIIVYLSKSKEKNKKLYFSQKRSPSKWSKMIVIFIYFHDVYIHLICHHHHVLLNYLFILYYFFILFPLFPMVHSYVHSHNIL